MELKFAELHAPLFMSGTNFGTKLVPAARQGLTLHYDRAARELHVGWKGETAIVPTDNVASMQALTMPEPATSIAITPPPARPIAQAETPQSHVFAGPGGGKTGQEGNRRAGK